MATTPTQLPVPSEKPQDLKFNAGKIDEFVTSMGWTYTDRFGSKHYTIEGINYLAQQVMGAFGYVTLTGLTFTTGATITNPNEVLFNTADNSYYKWTGSFASGTKVVPASSTPQSTGGIGPGKWLNVGDTVLRSQLQSKTGLNLIGEANYADIRALSGSEVKVSCYGRVNIFDGAAGIFRVDASDNTSADNDGTILVDISGRRWKRVFSGNVKAEWFGVIDGADISVSLQKALDLGINVDLPVGQFTSTVTFNRYKGQVISGAGIPERSIPNIAAITRITFANNVNGFSNVAKIAIGGGLRNLFLSAPTGSTGTGIADGIIGQVGGSSQAISCLHENIYVQGFANGVQIAGWSWETTLRRVHVDAFTGYGIALYDSPNGVLLDACSAIGSAASGSGTRTGFLFSAGSSVTAINPRAENNRRGFMVKGGARVNLISPYSEGNRDNDYELSGAGSALQMSNAIAFHTNNNTTTASIFSVLADCDTKSSLMVDGIEIIVSAGESGRDNKLTYMYVGQSGIHSEIKNIDWQGDGQLVAAFNGRYHPTLMTFTSLPGTEVRRVGNFNSVSIARIFNGATAPTNDDLFTITDYDGVAQVLKNSGSRAYCNIFSTNVDYWMWDGTAWAPRV